jgi:hypothetical protein
LRVSARTVSPLRAIPSAKAWAVLDPLLFSAIWPFYKMPKTRQITFRETYETGPVAQKPANRRQRQSLL